MLSIGGLLISGYVFVFYSHRYNELFRYTAYIGVLVSYCVVISLWFKFPKIPRWQNLLRTIITIIPAFCIFYGLYSLHKVYKDYQLKQNGVRVSATIIGFTKSSVKSTTYHYAVFEYLVNKKNYQQKISNDDDFYRSNDSLSLICSSQDPEIFRIITVKHMSSNIVYRLKY